MKTLGTLLGVALLLASGTADAAPPPVCAESYESAQKLRKAGKLVAARDQLHLCAEPACPGLMVNDCNKWLDEDQATIPSVVPLATDESGTNLVDVKVTIDGVPANAPPGQAIDLDPGAHHFVFSRPGSATAEKDALVAVGQKNKPISVVLRSQAVLPPPPAPLPAPPTPPPAPAGQHSSMSTLGVTGLVVAGAGVVGLAVGGVFGVLAITGQSGSHCTNNVCPTSTDASSLSSAKTDGNVSTALFIGGGALAAAGLATWIFAPSAHAAPSAWVSATPVALGNGGGLVLRGGF
jgi:hypothetical protein